MTTFLIFLGLFFVVRTDAASLKKKNEALYAQTIGLSANLWALLFALLSVLILPFYLWRRKKMTEQLNREITGAALSQEDPLETLTNATGMIISWACIVFFVSVMIKGFNFFNPVFQTRLDELVASSVLYSGVMVYLIYLVTRGSPYGGFLNGVAFRRGKQPLFKLLFIPFFAGIVLSLISSFILLTRKDSPNTPLSSTLDHAGSVSSLLYFLGMALVIAPLFEEWIFRGYFFSVLQKLKGNVFAVCFISSVFAVLHIGQYWGDWLAIAIVAVLGISLTSMRFWTDSTIASVVMHYTYNIFVTVIPLAMLLFSNPYYSLYATFYNQLSAPKKESLLAKSIEKYPQYMEAYNDLAWIYATEGKNLDEALDLVEEALAYYPDQPAFLDTKAEILYKMGYFEDAVLIAEYIVRNNPTDYFNMQLEKFKEALKSQEYL